MKYKILWIIIITISKKKLICYSSFFKWKKEKKKIHSKHASTEKKFPFSLSLANLIYAINFLFFFFKWIFSLYCYYIIFRIEMLFMCLYTIKWRWKVCYWTRKFGWTKYCYMFKEILYNNTTRICGLLNINFICVFAVILSIWLINYYFFFVCFRLKIYIILTKL